MPTRARGAWSASGPASSTVATIWWPGTTGRREPRTSPSRMCRSVRQTPQAWTATRTSPGPGSGSASSAARSGWPGSSRTMARTGPSSTLGDMAVRTDSFDLGRLRLSSGEGRRLTLGVALGTFDYGGTQYGVEPVQVDATLDVSRMTHGGYALRLRFSAGLSGPCMRCLEP